MFKVYFNFKSILTSTEVLVNKMVDVAHFNLQPLEKEYVYLEYFMFFFNNPYDVKLPALIVSMNLFAQTVVAQK